MIYYLEQNENAIFERLGKHTSGVHYLSSSHSTCDFRKVQDSFSVS
jgi:hypothetical protein